MTTLGFKKYIVAMSAIAMVGMPVVALAEESTVSADASATTETRQLPVPPKGPAFRVKVQEAIKDRNENIEHNKDLRNKMLLRNGSSTEGRPMMKPMMRDASSTMPNREMVKRVKKEMFKERHIAVLRELRRATTTLAKAHEMQTKAVAELTTKGLIGSSTVVADLATSGDLIAQANADVAIFANWKPQTADATGTVEVIKLQDILKTAKDSIRKAADSVRKVGKEIRHLRPRMEAREKVEMNATTSVQ